MKLSLKNRHSRASRRGFLLMEALLAFTIFGVAVTSIVIALHQTSKLSSELNRESWAQSNLKNLLTEVVTLQTPEDEFVRDEIRDLPDAKARILIELVTDISANKDTNDTPLKQLYRVTITLFWDVDSIQRSKSASTIHYYPLHQKR